MKENKYDEGMFFEKYSQMSRSVQGLQGAGEWRELERMLPDFKDKRVLDLGCGYGWHCRYAAEHGARSVLAQIFLPGCWKLPKNVMRIHWWHTGSVLWRT